MGARQATPETDELALRAAWLYHVDGLTQAQVAQRLFVSRATVGRLLERALASGVVRIEVDSSRLAGVDLALRLRQRFGLQDAVVVPADPRQSPPPARNERLAIAAADFVAAQLHPDTVVAIAWGDTVQRTLAHLAPAKLAGVTLATLVGGIDYISQRLIGHPAIGGHLRAVPAPLIVSSPEVAELLRAEPRVREVLALARRAAVTLTGVGATLPGSSVVQSGLVTDADVAEHVDRGAVGDMLGEWFDLHGEIISTPLACRRIGVGLAELRQMRNVIGIAGGAEKVDAIRGALAGGFLDVLITDELTAQRLLTRNVSGARTSGEVVDGG